MGGNTEASLGPHLTSPQGALESVAVLSRSILQHYMSACICIDGISTTDLVVTTTTDEKKETIQVPGYGAFIFRQTFYGTQTTCRCPT